MANMHDASASERAFLGLLDRLRDAADVIRGPKGARNARERAEGYRYLTRVLGASLEMHLENADPRRPTKTRMLSPIRKFLGDNPDTDYDYVPLDPACRYLVRGKCSGPITYLGFCVYRTREDHMPTPDITYTGASFELGDDDAVLIEGVAPRARYWSVQVFNRWLESPDYRALRVALNSRSIVVGEGGRFRVVLCARDPGVPNWLDSAGLTSGQIAIRALLAEDELEVELRRVDRATLSAASGVRA